MYKKSTGFLNPVIFTKLKSMLAQNMNQGIKMLHKNADSIDYNPLGNFAPYQQKSSHKETRKVPPMVESVSSISEIGLEQKRHLLAGCRSFIQG